MFLIITVLFSTICYIVYKITCTIYNAKDLKEAKENNEQFVYLADGTTFDRKNNILGKRSITINGEHVMTNWLGKTTYNYSLEEREKIKEWLLNHGYIVTTEYIPAQGTCLNKFRNGKYIGEKYRDLKTGDEYIIQNKNGNMYYLSLSTAMFVRLIDEDINNYIHFLRTNYTDATKEEYDSDIEFFLNSSNTSIKKYNEDQAKKKKAYENGEISISSLFNEDYIVSHDDLYCFAKELIS